MNSHARHLAREVLRRRIASARVPNAQPDNLRLATWNIRDLGKTPRREESIEVLARVIACFDFVSIVELRDDLTDLRRILHNLGPRWAVVCSDYTLDASGNRERFAFVYRTDRVRFTGVAANAEARRKMHAGGQLVERVPWWRVPYLATFEARGYSFLVVVAHIRWGKRVPEREGEVLALGEWLAERRTEESFGAESVLLLGDFNLATKRSAAWPALAATGLAEAPSLQGDPGSNLRANRRYDRIFCGEEDLGRFTGRAGTVDVFGGGFAPLLPGVALGENRLTWEISDHLPLWAEMRVGRGA